MDAQRETILSALAGMGLLQQGEHPRLMPLSGGISSDIFRVDLSAGAVCVKQARAQLRVPQEWRVSTERNAFEALWMRTALRIAPQAVPAFLGEDRQAGLFVMAYLPPEQYPLWKEQLRDGIIADETARAVGRLIGRIHAATAGDTRIEVVFARATRLFYALRLEPYFLATAKAHPECADPLQELSARTASVRRALVHGDVSPKNILVGAASPVLLDAEACCYGDPAFDLAFCLTHVLLKCLWRAQWKSRYLDCFSSLCDAYLQEVTWEPASEIEARAATLLPGLLLARVDGKSPVEYLSEGEQKELVRHFAKRLLVSPKYELLSVSEAWSSGISA